MFEMVFNTFHMHKLHFLILSSNLLLWHNTQDFYTLLAVIEYGLSITIFKLLNQCWEFQYRDNTKGLRMRS